MSISSLKDMEAMKAVSTAVAITLRKMREYARPGMNCFELDEYGGELLRSFGAGPAPKITYGFPGNTCISLNHEIAHGIPSKDKLLRAGDLVNIDVSAELNGYWSDNGGSFVLGDDLHGHEPLVNASKDILRKALMAIRPDMRIAELGRIIEFSARQQGFRVIRNLTGHGIGKSLHEYPGSIANYYDRYNRGRFRRNMVVAIETFISTGASNAKETNDGWTLVTGDDSFVAQHEHTIVVMDGGPVILTSANEIWN
ncbi:type I methionyl aminopeptidase [Flavihumibacter stibioxidans]|uniref:Methionine aminopeptidase n=1 Tax=Flavihumibacter stibioxidans TaxID=1834163 RepID=A0ABR7M6S0_9BACT|nr:type I methionyl aminopeptidase [Flavihumibacter stibioxidans]MBC6490722.1 type I methionyl aminopeptidase [Flavihumibacter stibioxidans]